jgi:hypothetical protein
MVLLGVFLLGCGASVASRHVVPVARADVPAHRWEYHCINANEEVTNLANQYGQDGWEMAAASTRNASNFAGGWRHHGAVLQTSLALS